MGAAAQQAESVGEEARVVGVHGKEARPSLHYFLMDACLAFLNWPALFPRPPARPAAQLLDFVVSLQPASPVTFIGSRLHQNISWQCMVTNVI